MIYTQLIPISHLYINILISNYIYLHDIFIFYIRIKGHSSCLVPQTSHFQVGIPLSEGVTTLNPGLLRVRQLHHQGLGLDVRRFGRPGRPIDTDQFWFFEYGRNVEHMFFCLSTCTFCDGSEGVWKLYNLCFQCSSTVLQPFFGPFAPWKSQSHPIWLSQVRVQPRMSAGCQQGSLSWLQEGRLASESLRQVETNARKHGSWCLSCLLIFVWKSGGGFHLFFVHLKNWGKQQFFRICIKWTEATTLLIYTMKCWIITRVISGMIDLKDNNCRSWDQFPALSVY